MDGLNQRSEETVDVLRERLAELQDRRAKQMQGVVGPSASFGAEVGVAKQLAEEEIDAKRRSIPPSSSS